MRVIRWFSLFMLLGFAVGISAAAPASAQGSGSDAGGGHGAILSRPEGAITPTGPLAAASLEPFWTSVKTAFGRYRFPIWARVRDLGGTNAAYLPPRKRVAP